ncbi:MAG: YihA family ribosome biogenesis GTP-binding protein [Micavibrio sp.]|nr:YihA family ribosome biogenesis GTP-binding protein [Micavibrio sp.]|tara:strand:+ start:397 stop:1032 length:636 start_codon:yes stop_codon:yes gene_type:complete
MSDELSSQQIEQARKLFAGPCDFMLGVAALKQLPEALKPEIALAGRSNVGKSSLINALTGRNTLAKVSNTPGRTQQLNYFNLGDQLYMVDMPGYGYAKVSKSQREAWTQLIFDYLKGRPTLACVFILIDSRHGVKDTDIELMKMLDSAAVQYRIILTKTDKIKKSDLEKTSDKIIALLKKHPAAYPGLIPTSSEKGMGIPETRAVMAGYGV